MAEAITVPEVLPCGGDATDLATLEFLGGLLRFTQPALIVEAGTFQGHFAIAAASACRTAHVWTADVVRHPEWPEVAQQFDLASRIHFHEGDFVEMLLRFEPRTVDFAYIDSGPACGHTVKDDIRWQHYRAVKPYMRPDGLVAVHDTDSAAQWQRGEFIVAEASLVLHGERGLTLWQAP